jgi:hypothetical protein
MWLITTYRDINNDGKVVDETLPRSIIKSSSNPGSGVLFVPSALTSSISMYMNAFYLVVLVSVYVCGNKTYRQSQDAGETTMGLLRSPGSQCAFACI